MSELKIPDFMQVYLDKLDGDEAYPEFYRLAKEYNETVERLKNNAGYHKASGSLQKMLNAAKADFESRAKAVAKEHKLDKKAIVDKVLSKEEKLAELVENFKEDEPGLEAKNPKELDLSAKQEKFVEVTEQVKEKNIVAPIKGELPGQVKPALSEVEQIKKDAERAQLLEEMRAARERNQPERER